MSGHETGDATARALSGSVCSAVASHPGSIAEEIHDIVRAAHPAVSLETVEDMLRDLVGDGDLSFTDFGAGAVYFPAQIERNVGP